MTVNEILDVIQDEALQADRRAQNACERSKYSVQDYHMCIEFYLQELHDRIASQSGLSRSCPKFPFRQKLSKFRAEVKRDTMIDDGQSDMFSETRPPRRKE